MRMPEAKLYSGHPQTVLDQIAFDMAGILGAAGLSPTGLHLLALIKIICHAIHQNKEDDRLGNMPSFGMLLSLLTSEFTDRDMEGEELEKFNTEFVNIIKSLGGGIGNPGDPIMEPFMAPASKEVH